MENAMEAIKKRISVRSYADRPLDEGARQRLEDLLAENTTGPFGNTVRFMLLNFDEESNRELRGLSTYGVIKGARLFILAAVKKKRRAMEDLGFCLEKIILEAAAMGLGTCWMGGTFRRGRFAARMKLAPDELLPAITPVGYPADGSNLTDRVFRFGAGSHRRKPWRELFFAADGTTALTEVEAGAYRQALEAVRLGPSASNRQPWRMLKGSDGIFHLYLKENRLYNRAQGKIRIQNIDMGIAMCHFSLAAGQSGLSGAWQEIPAAPTPPGLQHIAAWAPSGSRLICLDRSGR